MKKIIVFYLLGSIVWFLMLAALPMTQTETNFILVAFYYLTLGLFLGVYGRRLLERYKWVLILLPFCSLVATLLVMPGKPNF